VSYILDALRKAERDRQVARVPTLTTTHAAAEPVRRLAWAWAVGCGLALGAVVVYGFLRVPGRPEAVREAARPPAAPAGPAVPGAGADAETPPPPLARAPKRGEPAPALASGPAVERARPRVAPLDKAPAAERPGGDERRLPSTAGPSDAPETRGATLAQPSPAPVPAAPSGDPVTEPRPTADAAAPLAAVPAPRPSPDSGAGPARPRLTLDVLVYSDLPGERFVFVNGRKYIEGQSVDGDAVIEQITPEGAVLRHEGKQFVLRPKLNPYARPGSP
jgi:general secretion pathway protein B